MGRQRRRRLAEATLSDYPHGPDATVDAAAEALDRVEEASTIVLVEGVSDQIAVETLAVRLGYDLAGEGVVVLPMNGAQAIGKHVRQLGDGDRQRRLIGLCDVGERRWFERTCVDLGDDSGGFEFFVCDRDLEDELIRAAGQARIESLLDDHGELASFRTLQRQPDWRGEPFGAQFHRWLRAGARRNLRYARLLVDACDAPPEPLVALLHAARRSPGSDSVVH